MRRNKFHAQKTVIDGEKFDSRAEAKRWQELKLLERAGEITHLERQPVFRFVCACGCEVKTSRGSIAKYTADFQYRDKQGNRHVEDVKGIITEAAKLRIAVAEALYKMKVEIIKSR